MTNYNDLTQEQKESITKELRVLFEELERLNIENLKFLSKLSEIYEDNDFKRTKETLELDEEIFWVTILIQEAEGKIKSFQEGLKNSIKIIDDVINLFEIIKGNTSDNLIKINYPTWVESLKKQKEHLEWESNLE